MPLTVSVPPPGVLEAARAGLRQLATRPGEATRGVLGAATTPDLVAPHPVYHLGLDRAAEGAGLSAAQFTGWRLLLAGGQAPAAVEVRAAAGGGAPGAGQPGASGGAVAGVDAFAFARLSRGPAVDATFTALTRVAAAAGDEGTASELRLLRVPGLNLQLLWVHHPDAPPSPVPKPVSGGAERVSTADTFLPIAPAPLATDRSYTASELDEVLRPLARARLEQAERRGPTGGPTGG